MLGGQQWRAGVVGQPSIAVWLTGDAAYRQRRWPVCNSPQGTAEPCIWSDATNKMMLRMLHEGRTAINTRNSTNLLPRKKKEKWRFKCSLFGTTFLISWWWRNGDVLCHSKTTEFWPQNTFSLNDMIKTVSNVNEYTNVMQCKHQSIQHFNSNNNIFAVNWYDRPLMVKCGKITFLHLFRLFFNVNFFLRINAVKTNLHYQWSK